MKASITRIFPILSAAGYPFFSFANTFANKGIKVYSILGLSLILILGCTIDENLGYKLNDPFAGDYICRVEVGAPSKFKEEYDAYWKQMNQWKSCNQKAGQVWLDAYPDLVKSYEAMKILHDQSNRSFDYRKLPEARTWMNQHPTTFSIPRVALSAEQIDSMRPHGNSSALPFEGQYQKFFIHQSSETMYLTSSSVGLGAIDISERYRFNLIGQGLENQAADDLFIYNDQYAFLEGVSGNDVGNLFVMDISDPANPTTIKTLENVIAALPLNSDNIYTKDNTYYTTRKVYLDQKPSYGEYLAILEGTLGISDQCGDLYAHTPTYLPERIECSEHGSCTGLRRFENPIQGTSCEYRPIESLIGDDIGGFDDINIGKMGSMVTSNDSESYNSDYYDQNGGDGGAGSLSQMMISGQTLYVLTSFDSMSIGYLTTFTITDPTQPQMMSILTIDNGPEALFLNDNLILVSGREAMMVVSIDEPNQPKIVSDFQPMIQNCAEPVRIRDPIAMRGNIVYRTVGTGECLENRNWIAIPELQVIDLRDPVEPDHILSIPLVAPLGLDILGDYLFVADQGTGVEVFDIRDLESPVHVTTLKAESFQSWMGRPKDVIINHFDLYALSNYWVTAFYIAPYYKSDYVPPQQDPVPSVNSEEPKEDEQEKDDPTEILIPERNHLRIPGENAIEAN